MGIESDIAKRIKELRLLNHMTQEQLANKADIDTSFLGRIEREVSSNLRLTTLDKIVNAFDMDYATFFSFELKEESPLKNIEYKLSLATNKDELMELIEKIIDIGSKK